MKEKACQWWFDVFGHENGDGDHGDKDSRHCPVTGPKFMVRSLSWQWWWCEDPFRVVMVRSLYDNKLESLPNHIFAPLQTLATLWVVFFFNFMSFLQLCEIILRDKFPARITHSFENNINHCHHYHILSGTSAPTRGNALASWAPWQHFLKIATWALLGPCVKHPPGDSSTNIIHASVTHQYHPHHQFVSLFSLTQFFQPARCITWHGTPGSTHLPRYFTFNRRRICQSICVSIKFWAWWKWPLNIFFFRLCNWVSPQSHWDLWSCCRCKWSYVKAAVLMFLPFSHLHISHWQTQFDDMTWQIVHFLVDNG